MKSRSALALGVLLATFAGVALVSHARHRAAPTSARDATPPVADRVHAAPATTPLAMQRPASAPLAARAVGRDRDAHAWLTRADKVVLAKNARLFNPAVARLLALAPAEAWRALTARARDGDAAAAKAALLLATECTGPRAQLARHTVQDTHIGDHLMASLPQDLQGFVGTIDTQWRERLRTRMASCADVGGTWDFALMAIDRFMQPDDPETQLAAAQDIHDDATAIADLRQLADQIGSDDARRALGIRLMESRDPASQAEGRALLKQLAPNDPSVVSFLAACFSVGCGFFRGDPGVAAAWMEHAAGLGEWPALNTQITDLQTAGQATDAWAWALYRLDLAEAGCFESDQPEPFFIGQSAQAAFQLEGALTADQQAAGRATEGAIAARWLAQAEIAQACAG